MRELRTPRLLIAGVSSSVGKTTVTVALARALAQRGLRVAMFKCGPDYLDPTYHRRAAGRASHNLDGWMMGEEAVLATFADAVEDADIALIEGVMGLFDGASPTSSEGSSAEIARWLRAPVLLVVDASGMARSVAALAHGFAHFDPELQLAGIFCNRVGSASHLQLLAQACSQLALPPLLGGMLRDEAQRFPSRHLGLHAADTAISDADLDGWAARLSAHTDVERLLTVARAAPALTAPELASLAGARRCRIGIARDAAFSFYYPYNLRLLEQFGAELVPFSPLTASDLPDVDGLYFGGGYPELHAAQLSQNGGLRRALADFAARGRPIYAECGGLMFLSDAIVTLEGQRYEMMGLISGTATMQPKLAALGYVDVETTHGSIWGLPVHVSADISSATRNLRPASRRRATAYAPAGTVRCIRRATAAARWWPPTYTRTGPRIGASPRAWSRLAPADGPLQEELVRIPSFDLTGQVALVSGASRGIGAAIAATLAAHGAHVICASRKREACEQVAEQLRAAGGSAESLACHIGDLSAIDAAFAAIDARHGRLDILVNNAATNPYYGPIEQTEASAFQKTVDVNIRGYFFMTSGAVKLMQRRSAGAVVNIASVNGLVPGALQGIYSITKAAVIAMTQAFAKECAPYGVRVNALAPGATDTKFASALIHDPELSGNILARTPLGRFAQPEEMAGAVLYLVSPAASFTTGACLVVDGGLLVG